MEPILDVRNLTVRFGNFTAVDHLSFELHAGETLAIVGESGAGKSMSAMAVMRLVALGSKGRITEGEILFRQADGTVIDLAQQPERIMREIRGNHISMIFQEPLTSLNPVYTVGDQVMEAIILHQGLNREEARERAFEMLKRVGMRQRVMIAMALSCDPAILIADEPTTALDVTIQAQILGLMRELQQELDTAVMIITHDMGVVAEIADRALVMNQAKLVESGTVYDIFANPQELYTQALLHAVPRLGSMADRSLPVKFQLVDNALESMATDQIVADVVQEGVAPDYDAPPLLEVHNLTKRFPLKNGMNVHAVENVSLRKIDLSQCDSQTS